MMKILCFIALSALSASSLAGPIASFNAFSEVGFTISDSNLDVTVSSLITERSLDEIGSALTRQ